MGVGPGVDDNAAAVRLRGLNGVDEGPLVVALEHLRLAAEGGGVLEYEFT